MFPYLYHLVFGTLGKEPSLWLYLISTVTAGVLILQLYNSFIYLTYINSLQSY